MSTRTPLLSCGAAVWMADSSRLLGGRVGSGVLHHRRTVPASLSSSRHPWCLRASCPHLLLCVGGRTGRAGERDGRRWDCLDVFSRRN